jgi:predicted NAD-dependent protein-ADP-ribosyltransferase YbiA (DUF1768 family)
MIIIRKIADPHGYFGNIAPYPVDHEGKTYRTTEALFQCLRFNEQRIIEAIRAEKSPMAAKFLAKKHPAKMIECP